MLISWPMTRSMKSNSCGIHWMCLAGAKFVKPLQESFFFHPLFVIMHCWLWSKQISAKRTWWMWTFVMQSTWHHAEGCTGRSRSFSWRFACKKINQSGFLQAFILDYSGLLSLRDGLVTTGSKLYHAFLLLFFHLIQRIGCAFHRGYVLMLSN